VDMVDGFSVRDGLDTERSVVTTGMPTADLLGNDLLCPRTL
jgi:hypothetical protein